MRPVSAGEVLPTVPFDPLAAAHADHGHMESREANVPPQCYTRTGTRSNPCWTCHTSSNGDNSRDDWELQAHYAFSKPNHTNHWTNLFRDRQADIAAIDDAKILDYVRQENYTPLREALATRTDFLGWRPDIDLARGFDADGFASDGSGWRAFRYKPFPGTFWPTNGSSDDVMIRLPERFREDAAGKPSRAIYRANLAILELALTGSDRVPDAGLDRQVESLDEAAVGADLDGDGQISGVVTRLHGLPAHYLGAAKEVPVRRYNYPAGTEFLHSVRYLDPDTPTLMSVRLKELRYAVKRFTLPDQSISHHYAAEKHDDAMGEMPSYGGNASTGLANAYGWQLQGFIEDGEGRLRVQTREEQAYCMGCHTAIGVSVDQTFAFPRKAPGAAGWGHQDLRGLPDVPQAGSSEPEYLRYFERVGGGDEFRANAEMLQRFFDSHGRPLRARVMRSAPGGPLDIASLVYPSRQRALLLDKAYLVIVHEQSFSKGRDAVVLPVSNVFSQIVAGDTELKAAGRVYKDGRLWLDWGSWNGNAVRVAASSPGADPGSAGPRKVAEMAGKTATPEQVSIER